MPAVRRGKGPAVGPGHLHVEQDHTGVPLLDQRQRGRAIRGAADLIAFIRECNFDALPDGLVVVHDEDPAGRAHRPPASAGTSAGTSAGSSTTTRVPPSGGNSASMRPPCISTISRLM